MASPSTPFTHRGRVPLSITSAAFLLAVALAPRLSLAEDNADLLFPAGRTGFVQGEEILVWGTLPPRLGGALELSLLVPDGPLAILTQTVQAAVAPQTLSFWVDSAPLCPGSYTLRLKVEDALCQAGFIVTSPVPRSNFPIVAGPPPIDAAEARLLRSLGVTHVLSSDPVKPDADALAQAGLSWLRGLTMGPDASPAASGLVSAASVQLAVQAAGGGLRGVVVDLPPLPSSIQQVYLAGIFAREANRLTAALAVLEAAAGRGQQALERAGKLPESPARDLLTKQLQDFIAAGKFDKSLEADLDRTLQALEREEKVAAADVMTKADGIGKLQIPRAYADQDIVVAYSRRFGSYPPPVWEGNANWAEWQRFLEFSDGLWPDLLQAWSAAVKEVNPALTLVAHGEYGGADAQAHRIGGGPAMALEPLFAAARAREGGKPVKLWIETPRDASAPALRSAVMASMAAGAAGIVHNIDRMGMDQAAVFETAALNDLLARHGELLQSLSASPAAVAVLDSRSTLYFSLGQDPLGRRGRNGYPGCVACAWHTCTAAGFAADLVNEDDLAAGVPAGRSVVLAPALEQLPEEGTQALEEFVRAGGTVFLDADSTAAVKGALQLPFAFPESLPSEEPLAMLVKMVREHLVKAARPEVQFSRSGFVAREFTSGKARYIFALRLGRDGAPAAVEMSTPHAGPVYDVFAGELCDARPGPDGKSAAVRFALAGGEGKLFACLPSKIEAVSLGEPAAGRGALRLSVSLRGEDGSAVAGPVPADVRVTDARGVERFRVFRVVSDGKLALELPLGANEAPGTWTFSAVELFSGKAMAVPFEMPRREPAKLLRPGGAVDVFGRERCQALLTKSKKLTLVWGSDESRKAAESLAKGLGRLGIACEAKQATVVMQEGLAAAEGAGAIVIGSPADNELVRRVADWGLVPVADRHLAGRRPMLFWTQSVAAPRLQALVIWSAAADGLARGCEAALLMCAGREPEQPRDAKVAVAPPAAPKELPPPPALAPALSMKLDDSVTCIAAHPEGRFIVAGSASGQVAVFTSRGEKAWEARRGQPIDGVFLPSRGASDPLVQTASSLALMSIVSKEKWSFAPPEPRDGEAITCASRSPDGLLQFAATSAGRVFALDENGAVRWEAELGSPAVAMTHGAGRLAVAGESCLMLFGERGAVVWKITYATCSALGFPADGSIVAAGGVNGTVRGIDSSRGTVKSQQDLRSPVRAVVRLEDGACYAVAANGTVALVSADAAREWLFELGHDVQAVAQSPDSHIAAAASLDGTITLFTAAGVTGRFRVPDARVSALALGAEGRFLLVGDWRGRLLLFRAK